MTVGDEQKVFHTCDTLDDATQHALMLSRSTRRWTDNLPDPVAPCWVDIRDVRGLVIKQVNFWLLNKSKP